MTKEEKYKLLVERRKGCEKCFNCGLVNPSQIKNGEYDSEQIGPWTQWQGNLEADIIIVGQDWGSQAEFKKMEGKDSPKNPTNKFLKELMEELSNNSFFITNAALCIRKEGAQGGLNDEWLFNCRPFLIKQIEIIEPTTIIALGQKTFYSVLRALKLERTGIHSTTFKNLVDGNPIEHGGVKIFPVYHPGAYGQMSRKEPEQKEDWKRINSYLS